MQVAAPPKGSISVGWLWVSFLNSSSVHRYVDLHGAGVDLLALVEPVELPGLFEGLRGDGAEVHQRDRLRAPEALARAQVVLVRALEQGIVKADAVDDRVEGGVAAVVRPVGVQHADLGDGRLPALGAEIALAEGDVVRVHGEAPVLDEGLEPRAVQRVEAVEHRDLGGNGVVERERRGLFQRRLARLHGVDDVFFDLGNLRVGQRPIQRPDLRRADQRPLAPGDDLDALGRGVGPLVELTGQVLHGEDRGGFVRVGLGVDEIELRLGEDGADGVIEELGCDVLRVVAVEQTHPFKPPDAEQAVRIVQQRAGLVVEPGALFHKDSVYHLIPPRGRAGRAARYRYGNRRFQSGSVRRGRRPARSPAAACPPRRCSRARARRW